MVCTHRKVSSLQWQAFPPNPISGARLHPCKGRTKVRMDNALTSPHYHQE